jgi:methyl-accepting chemotaxis protein
VRKLAERSQQAAQEISELSSETVRASNEAGEQLEALLPAIQHTAELVQEISSATREQTIGAEQINEALRTLDGVIHENAQAAEAAERTTDGLRRDTDNLQLLLDGFRGQDGSLKRQPESEEAVSQAA